MKILPVIALLFSAAAGLAQTNPDMPVTVKVSVVDKAGQPIPEAQAAMEYDRGMLLQKGVLADGCFTFQKPDKSSATVFAAAPGFLGDTVKIQGEPTVKITLNDTQEKSSVLIYDQYGELKGKGGGVGVNQNRMGRMWMFSHGIGLLENNRPATDSIHVTLNQPVYAVSTAGKKFKIYVKEITPHICLIEYTDKDE